MRLSTTFFLAAVGMAPLLAALSLKPIRNRVADRAPMAEVTRRDEGIPTPQGGSFARVSLREDRTAAEAFPSRNAVWIRGNVRDGSSQPIAAAHLEIYLERGEERELLTAVETLEDGSFSCPSPRLAEMTAIERNIAGIVVRGSSEGIALWEASDTLPLAGDVRLDLEVDRRWASGRVIDEIGRPVAGAWIEAVAPSHPDLRETRWFARSYDDGRYGIPVSGPLERIEARAERVGWGSVRVIPIDPEGETLLPDLVLREESTIEGTARYPDGAPARWVDLRATPEDGVWERGASCRTDGRGRFRFAGLEAGIHAVTIKGDPFDDGEHLASTGDEEVDLVFDVYRVLVRVVVGGQPPLLGQSAVAYPIRRREDDTIEPIPSDSIAWFETSGPEAVAVLPVEPGRPYLVRAWNETAFPAEEIVEVPRGIHETEVTLALRPVERSRLDVRLLDKAGDPVESFFVELLFRRTGMREVES